MNSLFFESKSKFCEFQIYVLWIPSSVNYKSMFCEFHVYVQWIPSLRSELHQSVHYEHTDLTVQINLVLNYITSQCTTNTSTLVYRTISFNINVISVGTLPPREWQHAKLQEMYKNVRLHDEASEMMLNVGRRKHVIIINKTVIWGDYQYSVFITKQ